MDWIEWYKFTVGRQFTITVRDKRGKEIKISFKSYFGLNKSNDQLYSNIVDDIWKFYHMDIVNTYLDKFYNSGELEIRGIKLSNEGVQLKEQNSFLPWDRVSIKEYNRYFALHHTDFPDKHTTMNYNEYGSETLWSILKTILKEKDINVSQSK